MARRILMASATEPGALHRKLAARAVRAGAKPYKILNAASPDAAEVRIYDEISWYAVNAEEFARELSAITAPVIHLRMNSPGGSVFDGLAIYNTLRSHAAKVITHIDGVAASIASIIALAGEEVHMARGTFVMIHDPWTVAIGNAREFRDTADLLDKIGGSLAGVYAERTGKSVDEIQQLMEAETWWTAEEAQANGFATSIEEAPAVAAKFDFSVFNRAPAVLAGSGSPTVPPKAAENIRDFEAFLRDVGGFSHAEAKRIASAGFKADQAPRDEGDQVADLTPLASVAERIRLLSQR